MATIGDGFKDIFLAGIGAMAITAEKSKEVVEQLIAKGEITVDQGKQINTELKHKVGDVAATVRLDVLEASMAAMTPEERATFAAKAAEFAAKAEVKAKADDELTADVPDSVDAVVGQEASAENAPAVPPAPGA